MSSQRHAFRPVVRITATLFGEFSQAPARRSVRLDDLVVGHRPDSRTSCSDAARALWIVACAWEAAMAGDIDSLVDHVRLEQRTKGRRGVAPFLRARDLRPRRTS